MPAKEPHFHRLADSSLAEIVTLLAPQADVPVIVILGSADTLTDEQSLLIEKALRVVVAPAASERSAIVIDGGTDSGVMRLVGQTFRESGSSCRLIGVVPEAKLIMPNDASNDGDNRARPAPFHDDIVLTGGDEWGSELADLIGIVERLAETAPVLVIVAGGGPHTRKEFEVAQARRWPTLVLTGTGGIAEVLLKQYRSSSRPIRPDLLKAIRRRRNSSRVPLSARRHKSGLDVMFVGVQDNPSIKRVISWRLSPGDRVLKLAWNRVADFEQEAARNQPHSRRTINLALTLGVLTTFAGLLVVLQPTMELPVLGTASDVAYVALVVLPLSTTSMIFVTSRRRKHERWILVRAAAEALKREIYLNRCQPPDEFSHEPRNLFARKLEAIDNRLLLDVPNTMARASRGQWPPHALWTALHPNDRLLNQLGTDEYVEIRLHHQLAYFDQKIEKDDSSTGKRLWVTVALALVATVIAVTVADVAVAAALAATLAAASTAVAAGLAYSQEEQRVAKMADAAVGLRAVEAKHAAAKDGSLDLDSHSVATEAESVISRENEEWSRSLRQAFAMIQTASGQ